MTQNDKKSTYQRDVTILKERFTLNHFIIVFLQEFFATFSQVSCLKCTKCLS